MKVATRRLLEEQLVVVAVLGSGKKNDAMWHYLVPSNAHWPTPIDLCIVFQCEVNIYCILSCRNQLILTCLSVDRLLLHLLYITVFAWWKKNIIVALWKQRR